MNENGSARAKATYEPTATDQVRMLVVTALEDPENERVFAHLLKIGAICVSDRHEHTERNLEFSFRRQGGEEIKLYLLCLKAAGNGITAIRVMHWARQIRPNVLAFCGIAGTLNPEQAPLGTVVVGEKTTWYGYDKIYSSKSSDPLITDFRSIEHGSYEIAGALADSLRDFVKDIGQGRVHDVTLDSNAAVSSRIREGLSNWREKVLPKEVHAADLKNFDHAYYEQPAARPKVKLGNILSWEYVLNHKGKRDALNSDMPAYQAVEMEGGSMGYIAHNYGRHFGSGSLDFISIRGISDLCSEKEDDIWRLIASDAAACVLAGFIKHRLSFSLISPINT